MTNQQGWTSRDKGETSNGSKHNVIEIALIDSKIYKYIDHREINNQIKLVEIVEKEINAKKLIEKILLQKSLSSVTTIQLHLIAHGEPNVLKLGQNKFRRNR